MIKKRTTVYLNSNLVKLLKIRSIKTDESMSEYINRIVYENLMEEEQDLKDIKSIEKEETMSFKEMVEKLNIDDEL